MFSQIPSQPNEDPLDWIRENFENILRVGYSKLDIAPSDRISLAIMNRDSGWVIHISFRRRDQITTDIILSRIESVLQSNQSFLDNDRPTLRIDHIKMPTGQGRVRPVRGMNLIEFVQRKHGFITCDTDDNLCLANSLVLAKTYKDNDLQKLKNLTRHGTHLQTAARQLCQAANVDFSNWGSIDDVKKFQNYIQNYSIVVYNDIRG